jgi:hypothetical protein
MQCRAKSKRSQAQCRRHATPGRGVCRIHGGKSRIGIGSGTLTHGRRSKFLPSRLAAAYQDAMDDPKLIELREEIALVDSRINDLLSRVETGEAGVVWHRAQAALSKFEREKDKQNLDGMQLALDRLHGLITRGTSDYATWREIGEQIEQRRKLCEAEARRLHLAHDTLTADRAMVLVTVMVETVRRHVQDRAILGAIAQDLQALGMGSVSVGAIKYGE